MKSGAASEHVNLSQSGGMNVSKYGSVLDTSIINMAMVLMKSIPEFLIVVVSILPCMRNREITLLGGQKRMM